MSMEALFDLPESAAEHQWRLAEVQLANWGTFHGRIFRIPIARKGHLITGPSGSGKSSLLDAISAVITPDRWLRFNVAAQGASQRAGQRSLASYIRGAWSRAADEHEDRIVSRFLRPGATWSGVLLRYENEQEPDRPVTLARLFFAKGTATRSNEMASLLLLERSVVDLRELEPFARNGLHTRKVQTTWPDAVVTSGGSHARFYARMRSIFAIPNENALQLLHRTQSAKGLDSLDQLFRDYMLERPGTFRVAERAVEQFGELRDVHARVVELRKQRDHLAEMQAASIRYEESNAAAEDARLLTDAVIPYQKHRSLAIARSEGAVLTQEIARGAAEADAHEATYRRAAEALDFARQRSMDLGGGQAEQLTLRMREAEERARGVAERWDRLERQLSVAGIAHTPSDAAEFAELMEEIDRVLTSERSAQGPSHAQQERYFAAQHRVQELEREIAALRASRTGVPGALLDERQRIATAVGLPVNALPFAGELMGVDPEYAEWTGAIERVLRPLALTMLVRSANIPAVRRLVDQTAIRARLVYEEVPDEAVAVRLAGSDRSLVHRVHVAEGTFGEWVRGTLTSRFDFACVDTPDQLDEYVRAVTIRGQIKTTRTRYEKDDRFAVGDRSRWVLGTGEAKLEALATNLRQANEERATARRIVEEAERRRDADQQRHGVLSAVREQHWSEFDRAGADAEVAGLRRQLLELSQDNSDLRSAVDATEAARVAHESAGRDLEEARLTLRQLRAEQQRISETIADLEAEQKSGRLRPLEERVSTELDRRFRLVQRSVNRSNIAYVGQEVIQRLNRERDNASERATRAGNEIIQLAAQFNERWPTTSASAELTASIADRSAYQRVHDEIVSHGLPDYEARFLRLLRERSRDLVGDLVSEILGAPREVEERVEPVNTSLRRSPFDEGRFLRLRVRTRRSETVTRFIADLRSISEGGWGKEDDAAAEEKFATLAEIMRRFDSSEHIDRTWRNQCLDTRLHVTFLADEIDENGRTHATYDSGVAMSGGQQQKLVVFCLAAALRYQLAAPDDPFPRYGTIILDEAFDKADTRYTRMALDVFMEFGFHMVLATPQKLLQTIEPYVGAATSIENPNRMSSQVADVSWREESG